MKTKGIKYDNLLSLRGLVGSEAGLAPHTRLVDYPLSTPQLYKLVFFHSKWSLHFLFKRRGRDKPVKITRHWPKLLTLEYEMGARSVSSGLGSVSDYRATSLIRNHPPLGPFRRPMPRVLGGWAFSYQRSTPVVGLNILVVTGPFAHQC